MKWWKINPVEYLRGGLIFLFVYSGSSKLMNPASFVNDLLKASYLSMDYLPLLKWMIPVSEWIVAILLLFNKSPRPGLTGSLFLMALFTFHLLIIFNINPHSPCSCGALFASMSPMLHISFNVGLTGVIMIILYRQSSLNVRSGL